MDAIVRKQAASMLANMAHQTALTCDAADSLVANAKALGAANDPALLIQALEKIVQSHRSFAEAVASVGSYISTSGGGLS